MHARNATIRRALLAKGFGLKPRCPTCRQEIEPRHFSVHARDCGRRCMELAVEALDLAIAKAWARQPRRIGEVDRDMETLRHERLDLCFQLNPERFCSCGRVLVGQPDGPLCRRCDLPF